MRENELIAEMLREIVSPGRRADHHDALSAPADRKSPGRSASLQRAELKAGDLINTEVEGKYAGYIAQALQPISLGPKPQQLEKIFAATKIIFDRMLKFLKPGVTFGEVVQFYQDEVQAAGYEPDGALMHGRGLGEDAPMLWGARRDFPEKEAKLKEGHVFILKPACKEAFHARLRSAPAIPLRSKPMAREGWENESSPSLVSNPRVRRSISADRTSPRI